MKNAQLMKPSKVVEQEYTFYIQFPAGNEKRRYIPTGLYSSNFRTKAEAIRESAYRIPALSIKRWLFLSDAKSVLLALDGRGRETIP